jgi:hypothetical protein
MGLVFGNLFNRSSVVFQLLSSAVVFSGPLAGFITIVKFTLGFASNLGAMLAFLFFTSLCYADGSLLLEQPTMSIN